MRSSARFAFVALVAAAMSGCSLLSPRPDPSRFYVLTSARRASSAAAAGKPIAVGLGPVRVPDYLRRNELVTRVDANRLEFSGVDRWGEPIEKSLPNVLANDLSAALGNALIVPYPWFSSTHLDYAIEVHVDRFERTTGNGTQMIARWAIRDGQTGAMLLSGQSEESEAAKSANASDAVAALSADLGDLAEELASAIRGLGPRPATHPNQS